MRGDSTLWRGHVALKTNTNIDKVLIVRGGVEKKGGHLTF